MKPFTKSIIEVNIAVLLFGFAAIFGKVIKQSPLTITFGRVFFAAIALGLFMLLKRQNFKICSPKDIKDLILLGGLFAFHWFTFFQSIKVSNIAIAVLTFSTFPVFVTFIEPYMSKEKIKIFDIVIAIMTFIGILLIVPKYDLSDKMTQGSLWGIAAGFSAALLTILNKFLVKKYPSTIISFYQCFISTLLLLPFITFERPVLALNDFYLIVLLGVIFTSLSQTLFIQSMINIKAQFASIITCLEPIYGIIFAAILLNEIPTVRTIIGGFVILSTILYATINTKKAHSF